LYSLVLCFTSSMFVSLTSLSCILPLSLRTRHNINTHVPGGIRTHNSSNLAWPLGSAKK
jgi:hypothetical protein